MYCVGNKVTTYVGFENFAVGVDHVTVFCVVTSCRIIGSLWHSGDFAAHLNLFVTPETAVVHSSETLELPYDCT